MMPKRKCARNRSRCFKFALDVGAPWYDGSTRLEQKCQASKGTVRIIASTLVESRFEVPHRSVLILHSNWFTSSRFSVAVQRTPYRILPNSPVGLYKVPWGSVDVSGANGHHQRPRQAA